MVYLDIEEYLNPPDTEVPFKADDYVDVETIKFVGEPMLHQSLFLQ